MATASLNLAPTASSALAPSMLTAVMSSRWTCERVSIVSCLTRSASSRVCTLSRTPVTASRLQPQPPQLRSLRRSEPNRTLLSSRLRCPLCCMTSDVTEAQRPFATSAAEKLFIARSVEGRGQNYSAKCSFEQMTSHALVDSTKHSHHSPSFFVAHIRLSHVCSVCSTASAVTRRSLVAELVPTELRLRPSALRFRELRSRHTDVRATSRISTIRTICPSAHDKGCRR
jgi:hypothetical protein